MAKDKTQTSLTSKAPERKLKTPIKSLDETKTLEDLTANIKDSKKMENKEESLKQIVFQDKALEFSKDFKDKSKTDVPNFLTLKPLAEITVNLDEVTPLDECQRILLDDDDIQVTLNFAADRPSEHVSVIVMAVTNKSKFPVKDFQFEASVKKVIYLQ